MRARLAPVGAGGGKEAVMSNKVSPFILAAVSAFGAVSAQAADLPSQKAPPPPAPVPVFAWTGLHVGYNKGYGGGVYDSTVTLAAPLAGATATRAVDQGSGWFVGGQIGYDYQFANGVVLGLESDLQWSDIKSSVQAATAAVDPLAGTYVNASQSLEWFGTTRARLGYSVGRLLPYVTGGVAYGETVARRAEFLAGGGAIAGVAQSTTVGWTAGAGLDIALSGNLSARAEYLYVRLPGVSGPAVGAMPAPLPGFAGVFATGATEAHLIRGGTNYRFRALDDLVPKMDGGGLLSLIFQKSDVDWSGFHLGVNGGYAGGVVNGVTTFAQPGLAYSTNVSSRTGGAVAGGQLGYDYQFANQIVVGLETDAQWSGVQASRQTVAAGALAPNGVAWADTSNALTWFGTTRARLGYARGSSLLYGTGGVAYGELTSNASQLSGALLAGAGARTQIGWAVGSGTEYALTDKLSLKAEYLYVNFNGPSGQAAGIAATPFAGTFSTGRVVTQVTRVGLNWRFGGGTPAPVVAKY